MGVRWQQDLFDNQPDTSTARLHQKWFARPGAPRADTDASVKKIEDANLTSDLAVTHSDSTDVVDHAEVTAMDERSSLVFESVSRALAASREIDAVDALVDYFDSLFAVGDFETARRAMSRLDASTLPPKVLTGVLMVSAHARTQLGAARTDFFERVKSAMANTWHLRPEAIDGVERRLR